MTRVAQVTQILLHHTLTRVNAWSRLSGLRSNLFNFAKGQFFLDNNEQSWLSTTK